MVVVARSKLRTDFVAAQMCTCGKCHRWTGKNSIRVIAARKNLPAALAVIRSFKVQGFAAQQSDGFCFNFAEAPRRSFVVGKVRFRGVA